jgi:DNA-binding winged helix-turn-helix (wHTH) protein
MGKYSNSVEKLFFQGDYSRALAQSLDHPERRWSPRDLGFIVGSLCFLGRVGEAETLYRDRAATLSVELAIECRFFLGIGLTRQSSYARARAWFAENLRAGRGPVSLRGRFFIHQGASFYRYFCGKWRLALRDAEQAFEAAVRADFLYGKSLSSDLRGHLLIQMGEAPLGLKLLREAQTLAHRMDNRGVAQAIDIARVGYEAQFGLSPSETVARLQRYARKATAVQDTYSLANLQLELARQQLLRGRFAEALATLDLAGHQIYSNQNRRQEVTLNLRYAYHAYLSGDPARGLSFIRSGKRALDPAVDHALELSVLGLELKLVRSLGMDARARELQDQLVDKSRAYGGNVNRRMLARLAGAEATEGVGDPLGDARDRVAGDRGESALSALESGYLAFALELWPEARGQEWLCVDLGEAGTDTLTALDREGIVHSAGLTPLLRSLLRELARAGSRSKAELIRTVWKYPSYHPLKHNPVLYQAITALRKLLGARAEWLRTTEDGYQLKSGVVLRQPESPDVDPGPAESLVSVDERTVLNPRQMTWLRRVKGKEFFSVHEYRKMFKVSEITACRDLAGLTRLKLISRVGRARATRYAIVSDRGV